VDFAERVQKLYESRNRFGASVARRKRSLMRAAGKLESVAPRLLVAYHDILLFVAAHPDDARVLRGAEAELRRVARAAATISRSGAARQRRELENTGVAGTHSTCSFSFDLTAWLATAFPRHVELAQTSDLSDERIEAILPPLVERCERDGLFDESRSTREWLHLARGRASSDVMFLCRAIARVADSPRVRDAVFDPLDVSLDWALRERDASRTFVRFPPHQTAGRTRPTRTHYQLAAPLQRDVVLSALLERKLPPVRRLHKREAEALIRTARLTLAVRGRETDPVTWASPREVALVRLEHGIDVALFGMIPERRLPIESYFGYLVARNRVPIGYGGGWVFFDRCEVGVNIFDEFRGGESALAFAQVLRVYRQHYRIGEFRVDAYQFGAGNDDGLRSGAFWFYYRLGFRPADADVRKLAEAEFQRLRANHARRTSTRALNKLTRSRLVLRVDENAAPTPDLTRIGLAVTRFIARRFAGDRTAARAWCAKHVARTLGVSDLQTWPASERRAFEELSVLIAMIDGVKDWPAEQRKCLSQLMRDKGGPSERTYARRLREHELLRIALHAME